MTTSTRRTFTAGPKGPIITESVQLSQSARDRAIAAQTQNLEAINARQQRNANAAQGQAIYRGGGEFSTLGGDGGSRRTNITSGGVPIGAVVPNAGGLVGGMPAPGGGDAAGLKLLGERVAGVAFERGPQVGTSRPTPNLIDASNESTDIAPRYPQDRYYQTTTRQTWQWVATTGGNAGYWDVAAADDLLPIGVDSPAVEQYPGLLNDTIQRRVEAVTVDNYLANGTAGTAGAASVLVNGAAVTLGTTLLPPGGYLALSVTSAGTGRMIATVRLRQV
jgi:hypothetical protein